MRKQKLVNKQRWRRTNRVRKKLRGDATCPRLSVRRSNKHLYCQLIDDDAGKTLASASTRDKSLADQIGYGGNCEAAKIIGAGSPDRMSYASDDSPASGTADFNSEEPGMTATGTSDSLAG